MGIIVTVVAFFIPEQSGSMWPSVISAGIAALLYLVVFSSIWIKKIKSPAKRKAIATTFIVLGVFSIASAVISYESAARASDTLENIRTQIEDDLFYTFIHEPLVKTLSDWSSSQDDQKKIGEVFASRYDSLITESGLFEYKNRNDDLTMDIYVAESSSDSVVLMGESSYLMGEDAKFSNYSGNEGYYQVKAILTSKGISYERQN